MELLETTRGSYVESAPDPQAYRDFFYETFGPLVARAGGNHGQR